MHRLVSRVSLFWGNWICPTVTTWLDFFPCSGRSPLSQVLDIFWTFICPLLFLLLCLKETFHRFYHLSIKLCSRSPWLDFKFRFCVTKVPNSPPPLLSAFYDIDASATEHWHLQPQESLLCLRLKCAEGKPQSTHISVDCQVWFTAHNLLWD